jgi:hypothetical protein
MTMVSASSSELARPHAAGRADDGASRRDRSASNGRVADDAAATDVRRTKHARGLASHRTRRECWCYGLTSTLSRAQGRDRATLNGGYGSQELTSRWAARTNAAD